MKNTIIAILMLILNLVFLPAEGKGSGTIWDIEIYTEKEYVHLMGMLGFSDDIIKSHIELYKGYIVEANALFEQVSELILANKMATPEYYVAKSSYVYIFNAIRMHEYYFDSLGGDGTVDWDSRLYKSIEDNFGNFENWKADFIQEGFKEGNGSGWIILCQDLTTKRLINVWVDERDAGFLVNTRPILVMDVFDHAYHNEEEDEDNKKNIDAFFNNIKWTVVGRRLK